MSHYEILTREVYAYVPADDWVGELLKHKAIRTGEPPDPSYPINTERIKQLKEYLSGMQTVKRDPSGIVVENTYKYARLEEVSQSKNPEDKKVFVYIPVRVTRPHWLAPSDNEWQITRPDLEIVPGIQFIRPADFGFKIPSKIAPNKKPKDDPKA